MISRTKGRHQLVVAYVALFVALGGSAVAAKPLIDGSDVADESLTSADIQNNSLTGDDVQNDSLTGDDIVEAGLGEVPAAATAGSATTAGDADKLDGQDSTAFGAPNTTARAGLGECSGFFCFNTSVGIASKSTVVTARDLPAGTWLLVAKTNVRGTGEGPVECVLEAGSSQLDISSDELSTSDDTENLSLMAVATFSATQDVTMSCDGPDPSSAYRADIVAMRAG